MATNNETLKNTRYYSPKSSVVGATSWKDRKHLLTYYGTNIGYIVYVLQKVKGLHAVLGHSLFPIQLPSTLDPPLPTPAPPLRSTSALRGRQLIKCWLGHGMLIVA